MDAAGANCSASCQPWQYTTNWVTAANQLPRLQCLACDVQSRACDANGDSRTRLLNASRPVYLYALRNLWLRSRQLQNHHHVATPQGFLKWAHCERAMPHLRVAVHNNAVLRDPCHWIRVHCKCSGSQPIRKSGSVCANGGMGTPTPTRVALTKSEAAHMESFGRARTLLMSTAPKHSL